jgi:hypothetical protein
VLERNNDKRIKPIRFFAPQSFGKPRRGTGTERVGHHSRSRTGGTFHDAARQAQAALKDAKGTKLVLLGTGAGPGPGRTRKMTSHIMLSNGAAYVLDCGLGVTDRIAETGIPFRALRSIFITHHQPRSILRRSFSSSIMTAFGTKRTWRDVRLESGIRSRADIDWSFPINLSLT